LRLQVRDPSGGATAALSGLTAVTQVEASELGDGVWRLTLTVTGSLEQTAEAAVSALVARDIGVRVVEPGKASLEEVFSALTESKGAAT
jgi:hypothetical protein